MIRVYPSQIAGEPLETHKVTHRQTVHNWMMAHVTGYGDAEYQPVVMKVDGYYVPADKWPEHFIDRHSVVDVYPVPRGSDTIGAIFNPVGYFSTQATSAAVSYTLNALIDIDIPGQNGRAAGKPLAAGDIEANTVRPLDPIREIFGTYKIFPDYIAPSVSRFVDKRKLVSQHLMSVCAGDVEILTSDIRIGETPIGAFGTDADVDIYAPGADLSDDSRSQLWYKAPEVSSTNGGTAGLDLGSTAPAGSAVIADSVYADLKTVSLNGSDASFPESWGTGTIVKLKLPQDVVVGSSGGYNTFTANWQDLQPFVGMKVTVSTPATDYLLVVHSFTDNAGVDDVLQFNNDPSGAFNDLPAGAYRISVSYRNYEYQIMSIAGLTATINRLTDTGTVDASWLGFTARTVVDYDFTSDTAGDINWIGPFLAVPDGRMTSLIEYDVYFPSGLIVYDKDGDEKPLTRTAQLQWRDADLGGAWTTVDHSFTERTVNAIGFSYSLSVPYAMRPQVRMRRVEAEGQARAQDKMQWYGLRSLMPERPTSYPCTVMAVTVRSGDRLGAQTDRKISVVASKATAGIADAFYYVTDSLGIDRALIDEAAINALSASYWVPRGDEFNMSVSGQQSARDVLNTILRAGYAQVIPQDGLISAVREGVKEPSGIITPHEQTQALQVGFKSPSDDDFNGVDVEYVSDETWKTETVQCRLPGVTATKVETISADGVTSRTRAWRLGMRALRKSLYQRITYDTATEMDARNYEFGSVIRLVDDIPQTTQSALIVGYSVDGANAVLSVSEEWQSVTGARIIIRRHDGTSTGLLTPVQVGYKVIVLPLSAIDFDIVTDGSIESARIVLCSTVEQGYSGIITAIEPSQDGSTTVRAVEYNPAVYADDDNAPE